MMMMMMMILSNFSSNVHVYVGTYTANKDNEAQYHQFQANVIQKRKKLAGHRILNHIKLTLRKQIFRHEYIT